MILETTNTSLPYRFVEHLKLQYAFVALFHSGDSSKGFGMDAWDWMIAAGNSSMPMQEIMEKSYQKSKSWFIFHTGFGASIDTVDPEFEPNSSFEKRFGFEAESVIVSRGGKLEYPVGDVFYSPDISSTSFEKQANTRYACDGRYTKSEYLNTLGILRRHLERGDIYETNFCVDHELTPFPEDGLVLFRDMQNATQAPMAAYFFTPDWEIVSLSPERFLFHHDGRLMSQPIKGTARRSANTEENTRIANSLMSSLKERTENIMVVDLVRNDLSQYALPGSVEVEELCGLYSFKYVHQLISTVSATIDPSEFWKAYFAAYPMGSMTGVPKAKSVEYANRYESFARGPYSGAVGFCNGNTADSNVLIRSIFLDKRNKRANIPIGGAITLLSDPEEEYQEILTKLYSVLQATSGKL